MRIAGLLLLVALCVTGVWAADAEKVTWDKDKCESLGLSLTECRQIQKSGLAEKKVHELLECGISISEYFKEPWKALGLSEKKWIKKRRSGLTNEDMAPVKKEPKAGAARSDSTGTIDTTASAPETK